MSEDKEIQEINNKKLKAKGAKVVQENQQLSYEQIVMQMCDFLNTRGLEFMNVSEQLKGIIVNERQKKNEQKNKPDSEKQ